MFSKKCGRCNRKIEKEFDFCPYCGLDFRREKKTERDDDFGLLGKDDFLSSVPELGMKMPMGFGNLFNSLMKQVDSQFRELDRKMSKEKEEFGQAKKLPNSSGISISISTATGKKPEIKIKGFGPEFGSLMEKEARIEKPRISEEDARRLSKLPRKEAETKVRRLSNKVVYEIEMPGVKSLKDIVINKLENSVEIKAFSEEKVYFKLIPVKLPVSNYKLENGKLVVEFLARN